MATYDELKEKQVGGTHYKDMKVQPWDFYRGFMPLDEWYGYLLGNIIDYLVRAKNKNGLEDLKKAQHLLDVLVATGEEIKAEDETVFGDHNIPLGDEHIRKASAEKPERPFKRNGAYLTTSGVKDQYCPLNTEHKYENKNELVCVICGCQGLPKRGLTK